MNDIIFCYLGLSALITIFAIRIMCKVDDVLIELKARGKHKYDAPVNMKTIDELQSISSANEGGIIKQFLLSYEKIIDRLHFAAECGLFGEWFDIYEISDENCEKLKEDGFNVEKIKRMSKIHVSWEIKGDEKI